MPAVRSAGSTASGTRSSRPTHPLDAAQRWAEFRSFEPSPLGTVQPQFALRLIDMFRYDENGKLAEEWVQYDILETRRQLGVELAPVGTLSLS